MCRQTLKSEEKLGQIMLRRNIARRLQSSSVKKSFLLSIFNPSKQLFSTQTTDKPKDQKLRSDIKHLGAILGSSIRVHDNDVFQSVEELRLLGREV